MYNLMESSTSLKNISEVLSDLCKKISHLKQTAPQFDFPSNKIFYCSSWETEAFSAL